jgi:hypothetical protein
MKNARIPQANSSILIGQVDEDTDMSDYAYEANAVTGHHDDKRRTDARVLITNPSDDLDLELENYYKDSETYPTEFNYDDDEPLVFTAEHSTPITNVKSSVLLDSGMEKRKMRWKRRS